MVFPVTGSTFVMVLGAGLRESRVRGALNGVASGTGDERLGGRKGSPDGFSGVCLWWACASAGAW
jgi:hypothetical protein